MNDTAVVTWWYQGNSFEWQLGSAADVDLDGIMEVLAFVGDDGDTLFCFEPFGSDLDSAQWKRPMSAYFPPATPALADVDGDGCVEILTRLGAGLLYPGRRGRLLRLRRPLGLG